MLKKYIPLMFTGTIFFAMLVRIVMSSGWFLLFEMLVFVPSLLLLLSLSVVMIFRNHSFPLITASVLLGLYFPLCILASDISDRSGVYYFGSFHSTGNDESVLLSEQLGTITLILRIIIMIGFLGCYIYGAVKKPKLRVMPQQP